MSEGVSMGKARVIGSSEKALRVKCEHGTMWIPRSAIHDDSEVFDALNNASGELVVEARLAAKEGWT